MIEMRSNEEVYSRKLKMSDIIDLDDKKRSSSISQEHNNLLDLTFLTQLGEVDCNNDQMFKGVVNCSLPHRSKSLKICKKEVDLLCVICEDHAIGFNYDALTCASCKAFFRRNAQYNPEKLRCLSGGKICSVNRDVPRKCQRCRLAKCLLMGMRKDFILSEEEKRRRRERIEENKQLLNKHQSYTEVLSRTNNVYLSQSIDNIDEIDQIDRLLMDMDNDTNVLSSNVNSNEIESRLSEGLSIEDWSDIENIRLNYCSIFENSYQSYGKFDLSDQLSALISWSEFASERSLKLIHFCQQIEEFENLNIDDRFILIKSNLLTLYIIQKCFYYNPLTRRFTYGNDEEALKRRQFFQLCYGESGIREYFKSLIHSISLIIEQDSTLLNLILIILLFSKGLSMNENEGILNDEYKVNRAQSHYTRLTWNYLLYKRGEREAWKQWIQLMGQISRIQSYTKFYRDFFRKQIQSRDALERFAPLMQALLNIV